MNTFHPSRRYSIDPSSMERSIDVTAGGAMDYEQANVESFDAALKSVAEKLSVGKTSNNTCHVLYICVCFS